MPPYNFPEDIEGVGAAIWEEIGKNLLDNRVSRTDLLNPQHPVNTTWDYPAVFTMDGRIAWREGTDGWRLGDEILVPDNTPPVISLAVGSITETGCQVTISTDENNGTAYAIISSTMPQPDAGQISNGLEYDGDAAVAFDSVAVTEVGAVVFPYITLTAGTTYWAHGVHIDAAGNASNISTFEFTTATESGNARDSFPDYEPKVGQGRDVTGGTGYAVYAVTSGANGAAAGTFRWAVDQCIANGGGIIWPVVNQICYMTDNADDTGRIKLAPNVTYYGEAAPGTGFIFEGGRMEPEEDNIHISNLVHIGLLPGQADGAAGSNADNMRVGPYTNSSGTAVTTGFYMEKCGMINGQDEAFSITPRPNGSSTGNIVEKATIDKCLIEGAISTNHEMGLYLADGSRKVTVRRSFLPNVRARAPGFVRQYTQEIELVNNMVYNYRQRPLENLGPQTHAIGNYFRPGPYSTSTHEVLYNYGSASMYQLDNICEGSPLTGGPGTLAGSPLFTGSTDLDIIPASQVPNVVPQQCGPRMYGGATYPVFNKRITEMQDGSIPNPLRRYATADRIDPNGGTYPAHNGNYVPNAYLAVFPEDTDLASIIADGSTWDGQPVAARVARWLQWDGTIIPSVPDPIAYESSLPFDFGSDDTQSITFDEPAGTHLFFAISARAIDVPGISAGLSTYNAANLTDFGEVGPATEQTLDVKFHLYHYVSDGTPATFFGNTEGAQRRGIDGIIVSGVDALPVGYHDSTDGTDQYGTAIAIPTSPSVAIGDFVIGFLAHGGDTTTQAIGAPSAIGLDGVSIVQWGHSDMNSGLGHYWIVGTANSTDVGPITATGGAADYWQAASLVLTPAS